MAHQVHPIEVPILHPEDTHRIYTKSVRLAKSNESDTDTPEIILWAGPGYLFVSADFRGVALDDLQIRVGSTRLTFSGDRPSDLSPGTRGLRQIEKTSETFSHVLELPYEVVVDQAEVQNENGLISIILKRKDSRQQNGRIAQSSFMNSMKRFFGENGESADTLKDEIMILETLERYPEYNSGNGFAR